MSLFLAWCLKHWRAVALVAFLCAVASAAGYGGFRAGVRIGEAQVRATELAQAREAVKAANQRADDEKARRERQERKAEGLNAINQQYLEELNHANDRADRLAADVRSGAVRIRKLWAQCAVPASGQPAPDSGEPEDRAGLQAASLGRIDRAVSACEAQVKALLRVAECDRGLRADCREES